MSEPKITRTISVLRGIIAQHRTLRKDWHPRAKGNRDYQAGYEQAMHDTRNVIMQAIRDEHHLVSTPQIIRTVEELEALDPDTALMQSGDGTNAEMAHEMQGNKWYAVDFPAVVVATGEQVRAARTALQEADGD